MSDHFSFSEFTTRFPNDDACWEEIRIRRYPHGIYCTICRDITTHYKLTQRPAYSCKNCRHQVFPLAGTLFEKSTTPLRLWFYAMFLMTQTHASLTIRELSSELGVSYKTSWRMYRALYPLMQEGNLLDEIKDQEGQVRKWLFFNTIEILVSQKKNEANQP